MIHNSKTPIHSDQNHKTNKEQHCNRFLPQIQNFHIRKLGLQLKAKIRTFPYSSEAASSKHYIAVSSSKTKKNQHISSIYPEETDVGRNQSKKVRRKRSIRKIGNQLIWEMLLENLSLTECKIKRERFWGLFLPKR
eukprot:TRINITY_DN19824_c0_g1_i1.p1 TRINITY_DN19824_c0_g1~~TRINITY_DN19824_c0_g1_i1.p1  ORF type:complete len:136 (+),score=9.37 TRINITY_DN19824_c0_g1_i1:1758-2165(+)